MLAICNTMAMPLVAALLLGACTADLAPYAEDLEAADVFGDSDDRQEVYEYASNESYSKVAEATALVVARKDLSLSEGDDTWSFDGNTKTLGEERGLCEDERFAEQPVEGFCTGILVGPDLLLTAGHCVVVPKNCADIAVVFGYEYQSPGDELESVRSGVPAADVYHCKEAIDIAFAFATWEECEVDFALLRLDRPVTERRPMQIAPSREAIPGMELAAVGHPSNLPKKITAGGSVQAIAHDGHNLHYDLDTFGGNSGSPVVDDDGELQAIHICGPIRDDYVSTDDETCRRPAKCEEPGCDGWAVGFHTAPLAPLIACAKQGVSAADCVDYQGYPEFRYEPPESPHM